MRVLLLAFLFVSLPTFGQTTVAGSTPGSFRVTEGGAAEYRIPIRVPPGIAGMEPRLALVYNSQAGNGLLGMGWDLEGLSAIGRCPRTMAQDGVRGGIHYDANDRFCLDGQRLMAISGTYGADGTEYRTERESFTKVISYGAAGNGPAWFKAWTKSGQIIEYGNTADSRIEAQGKPTVRVWAQNKISDTKGNYLTVSYIEDSPNGDYRPDRIDYAGNSVRFSHESRTDSTPAFRAGSVVKTSMRLANAKTHVGEGLAKDYRLTYDNAGVGGRSRLVTLTECDAASTCLPAHSTSWTPAPNSYAARSQWAADTFNPSGGWFNTSLRPQVFVVDVNGDGLPDILGITDNYVGVQLNTGSSYGPRTQWASTTFNPSGGWFTTSFHPQVFVVDVNGDGLTDILGITDDYVGVQLNTGSSYGPRTQWASTTFNPSGGWFNTALHPQVFVVDVNGDGLTDILGITDNYVGVQLNTGSSFGPRTQWASTTFNPSGGWFNTSLHPQVFVVDVNGDGLPDILGITDNYVGVQLNTGSSFGPREQWASTTFDPSGGWFSTSLRPLVHVVDVNGDGLPDILGTTNDYVGVQLNTGSSYGPRTQWASTTFNPSGGWFNTSLQPQVFVVDVNGDGLPDILGITDNYVGVQLNTGSSYGPRLQWASTTFNPSGGWFTTSFHQHVRVADVNGDGQADFIGITDNYVGVQLTAGSAGFNAADRLAEISSGSGAATSVSYRSLTDATVYTKDTGALAAAYPLVDLQMPFHVVSAHTSSDGIGGTAGHAYRYAGAKSDVPGRGFLGFREVELTQQSTGLKVRTQNRQDWPYVGLPSVVKKTQSSGAVLGETSNTYSCTNPATGSACTVAAGNRYFPFASQSVETGNDLNGAALPAVTTTTTYDLYGNATSVVVSTGDGYSKTTTNSFANDVANWFLGRLTRSTVLSVTP